MSQCKIKKKKEFTKNKNKKATHKKTTKNTPKPHFIFAIAATPFSPSLILSKVVSLIQFTWVLTTASKHHTQRDTEESGIYHFVPQNFQAVKVHEKKKKKSQAGAAAPSGCSCWRVVGSSRPGFPSPWVHLDKANWMRQNNTLCKWFFWSYASSPDLRGTVMVVLWDSHQRYRPSDTGMPREQGCLPASLLSFTLTTHCLHIFHSLWAERQWGWESLKNNMPCSQSSLLPRKYS